MARAARRTGIRGVFARARHARRVRARRERLFRREATGLSHRIRARSDASRTGGGLPSRGGAFRTANDSRCRTRARARLARDAARRTDAQARLGEEPSDRGFSRRCRSEARTPHPHASELRAQNREPDRGRHHERLAARRRAASRSSRSAYARGRCARSARSGIRAAPLRGDGLGLGDDRTRHARNDEPAPVGRRARWRASEKGRHLYVDRQRVTQRIALAQRDPRGHRDGNDA